MTFIKGQNKPEGSGRPAGGINKTTALIKTMVMTALEKQTLGEGGGAEYLRIMATQEPRAFLGLIGKLLPAELRVDGGGGIPLVLFRNYTGRSEFDGPALPATFAAEDPDKELQ